MAEFPEFIVSTTATSLRISRAVRTGKLRPLGSRLFTSHLSGDCEELVRRNIWKVVPLYFPNAVIVDRTALEMKPASDGTVFLVAETKRDIELPGIRLRARAGAGRVEGDFSMRESLYCSSRARALVENMVPSRSRIGVSRTVSRIEIEDYLIKYLRTSGEVALNLLRDQINDAGRVLGLVKESGGLDTMIGTLLGTKNVKLSAPSAIAHATGSSFDLRRVDLFNSMHDTLRARAPQSPRVSHLSGSSAVHMAFFEAYFSNFIEGTKFEVEEAEDIIFNGAIPSDRPADAHDIKGTFAVVSNPSDSSRIPKNFDEFLELLKWRHQRIMEGRPEKRPGEFKSSGNQAGATVFVRPEDVVGTLRQGFDIYQRLEAPLDRAIFIMFMVAEVHPFADGNGRAARIMMNAELSAENEARIIIPTVYRSNYLEGLRLMSNYGHPDFLLKTLEFGQLYSHAIDWTTLPRAMAILNKTNAFVLPEVGDREGIRLRLPRAYEYHDDNDGGDGAGRAT